MVYFLRPKVRYNLTSPSLSASKSPLSVSPVPQEQLPSLSSLSSLSSVPTSSESGDLTVQKVGMFLLIALVVAAIVYIVVVKGLKPNSDRASFLTSKDKDGNVVVSQGKVIGLSAGVGVAVALVSHLVSE